MDSTEDKVCHNRPSLNDTVLLLAKAGCSQKFPDQDFSREITDNLGQSNVTTYYISPIEFKYINIDQLTHSITRPSEWSGIILTSTRCVEALVRSLLKVPDRFILLEKWSKLKIFTVGEATRQFLLEQLQLESTGYQSGNSAILTQFILDSNNIEKIEKPLLYPCSSIRSDFITEALHNRGLLKEIICYETVPNQQLAQELTQLQDFLESQCLNGKSQETKMKLIIVFFSPSGVDNLLPQVRNTLMGICNFASKFDVMFVAFGKVTATKLASVGQPVWFVASAPNAKALAKDLSVNLKQIN